MGYHFVQIPLKVSNLIPFSRVDKIEVQQLELKEDINKLRSELTETRSTILQALADSEARILQRLSQISDEVKSFKT